MKTYVISILLWGFVVSASYDLALGSDFVPFPYPDDFCSPDMWTLWYDVDDPNGEGDMETIKLIKQIYPEEMCDEPVGIEGRLVRTNIAAEDTGQNVLLSKEIGLVCKNQRQICKNYEVRFCCPKLPSCTDGVWTQFISVDVPGHRGDFETLQNVRLVNPNVCTKPTAADARRVKDGLHWSVIGRGQVTNNGFVCKNTDSFPFFHPDAPLHHYQCDDYEVRFCCPRVNSPQCGPLDWTQWINSDNPFDGCDSETLVRIWSKYPDQVCKYPSAFDVREAVSGKPYELATNIEATLNKGFKCCDRFGRKCPDYEIRFCCPKEPPAIPHCSGSWTEYFDADDPSVEGDYELLDTLRDTYPDQICAKPLAVDAKAIGTYSHYPIPGQVATISSEEGFFCKNALQAFDKCLDYEVRFCCPEEPSDECAEENWTRFFDIDEPTGGDQCDCEDLTLTRYSYTGLCPNPTAMEVRLTNGADISTVNQVTHKSLTKGFQCYNDEQKDEEICCDYKVRYCCPSLICPGCQVYNACGSAWPATCYNHNFIQNISESCIPGCRCTDGLVINHLGECVIPSNCVCTFNEDKLFLSPTCDSICGCANGLITCTPVVVPVCAGPCVDNRDGSGSCLLAALPPLMMPPPPPPEWAFW